MKEDREGIRQVVMNVQDIESIRKESTARVTCRRRGERPARCARACNTTRNWRPSLSTFNYLPRFDTYFHMYTGNTCAGLYESARYEHPRATRVSANTKNLHIKRPDPLPWPDRNQCKAQVSYVTTNELNVDWEHLHLQPISEYYRLWDSAPKKEPRAQQRKNYATCQRKQSIK